MLLIDKMRAATQSVHQELDHSLLPYIENIESKEDYTALLLLFYGYFKPVYDSIDACIDTVYLNDYGERRRADWILNDLENLDVSYNIQFCRQLPHIYNNASAFGAMYVLEGSTLGGMVIRKMISDKLDTEESLSFFNGYGRQTRERWNIFVHALNNIEIANNPEDTVIQTAVSTFTFFKDWLQQSCLHIKQSAMLQ